MMVVAVAVQKQGVDVVMPVSAFPTNHSISLQQRWNMQQGDFSLPLPQKMIVLWLRFSARQYHPNSKFLKNHQPKLFDNPLKHVKDFSQDKKKTLRDISWFFEPREISREFFKLRLVVMEAKQTKRKDQAKINMQGKKDEPKKNKDIISLDYYAHVQWKNLTPNLS
jgi:hypothetical protein